MEDKNFLEILQEKIRQMLENGDVSRKDLIFSGIEINRETFRGINVGVLDDMIDRTCRSIDSQYDNNSKKKNSPKLRIVMEAGTDDVFIEVQGRDLMTGFIISDKKDVKTLYPRMSTDTFIHNYINQVKRSLTKVAKNIERYKAKYPLKGIPTEEFNSHPYTLETKRKFEADMEGIVESIQQRSISEKAASELEEQETESDVKEPIVIDAGIISPDVGSGKKKNNDFPGKKVIKRTPDDFILRDRILREMKPVCVMEFKEYDKEQNEESLSYTTYVYKNPNGNEGWLLFSEPFKGDRRSKAVFVSKDNIGQFMGENRNASVDVEETLGRKFTLPEDIDAFFNNEEFSETRLAVFQAIIKEHLEMNEKTLSEQKFACAINHCDIKRYEEKLKGLIMGNTKNTATVYGVMRKLYKGINPSKQMKSTVKKIVEQERVTGKQIDEVKEWMGELTLSGEQIAEMTPEELEEWFNAVKGGIDE